MLTAKQVQTDVIALLQGSELAASISGKIYRGTADDSYRPRDSKKEDIIVIFTTGTAEQIEEGTVTINIYVPDVSVYGDGTLMEDGSRTLELERLAAQWVDSLQDCKTDYRFTLQQTIWTEREPSLNQHFVVVKLAYQHLKD